MTLPHLWLANPSLWFIQVENKFRIHRITSEVHKRELLVEALPPQAMPEIRDILVGPPGDTPYTTVNQALLHRLVPPKLRRIQQLLCNEELGDRRPTHFLRHLQHQLGDQLDGSKISILRELFLQRLPPTMRMALVPAQDKPLSELAEMADDMMDVAPAVINTAHTSPNSEADSLQETVKDLAPEVTHLRLQLLSIRNLDDQPCPHRPSLPSAAPQRPLHQPEHYFSPQNTCYYHRRFHTAARRFVPPCSWNMGNAPADHQ
ncbi:uncharacterized protein LOC142775549 [Rhipicephalus microplus]|uniref:uncharacterized protein LOC142775549 n=1 Tax=Rhipicephalus microplus TaxID=6941 RepID=UPI003F6C494B